jgi:Flp pilus assembly pilin Flp
MTAVQSTIRKTKKGGIDVEEMFLKGWVTSQVMLGDLTRRLIRQAPILRRLNVSGQEGQTAVEYGLIVGFVALAVVAAFTLLGGRVRDAINAVAQAINIRPQ